MQPTEDPTSRKVLAPIVDPGPHPGASTDDVRARMSRLRRRDNGPEVAVRQLLTAAGLRYRVAYRIPGQRRRTIDIAVPRRKLAAYIDGCFWHSCPEHLHLPKANTDWWRRKMEMNRARDAASTAQLETLGWSVLRFWEHEPPTQVAATIIKAVCFGDAASNLQLAEQVRALMGPTGDLRHARASAPHHPCDALAGFRADGKRAISDSVV